MFLLLDRLKHLLKKVRQIKAQILRACLVGYFKQLLEHFKHTNTHFHILFHLHIYQKHQNNITQIPLPNTPNIYWVFLKKKMPLVLEAICSLCLFMRYPLCFYIPGELLYEQYEGYGAKMARSQNIMSFDQFFFLYHKNKMSR